MTTRTIEDHLQTHSEKLEIYTDGSRTRDELVSCYLTTLCHNMMISVAFPLPPGLRLALQSTDSGGGTKKKLACNPLVLRFLAGQQLQV